MNEVKWRVLYYMSSPKPEDSFFSEKIVPSEGYAERCFSPLLEAF